MKLQVPLAVLLFLLFSGRMLAAPLSGVYTIGGSSPSYATFTLAVAALTANGVNGPVVFNVRPGTYNEQITIPSVTGVNATNTVIFQSQTGVAADVILSYAATSTVNNWVVKLNGAAYIIFNKMTLQAAGTAYSRVVTMYNASQWDTVKNCVLTAPVATTSNLNQAVIDAGDDATNSYYNGFYNDTINNGSYGFYTAGTGSCYVRYLLVKDNVFLNQYAYGICNNGCLWGLLRNNIITTNSGNTSYYGIYINIAIDSLDGNKITNCPGNGIWWDNGAPNIFNNFIELTGTAVTYGLTFTDMNESGTTSEIAYNTVLVLNTNPNSSAFYIPTGYDQPLNFVQNNVFINRGGGYAANIVETGEVSNPNGWGITSLYDYNDYYTTGTYIGNWGGTNCTTFANWQTTISSCSCGGDSHSMNINPSFVSNTDLHITADNLRFGNYDPRVLWDIDGETRNATTPDVGADEFNSNQAQSVQANFTAGRTNICSGSMVHFTDMSTGSPTKWTWTFTGGSPDTSSSKNPVVSYDSAGAYTVKLVVSNAGGSDSLIKTGYITVTASPVAGLIAAHPDTICSGDSSRLSATENSGILQWESSANGINFTDINGADSSIYIISSLSQTTIYRLIATNGNCSDTSSAIILTVNRSPFPPPVIVAGDSAICASDSALICSSGSYSSYSWNNGDTQPCTYAKAAGGYWVTVTNANGCSVVSSHQDIIVYPLPAVSLVTHGDTLSSSGAVAYQWYLNGDVIAGATSAVYIAGQSGEYAVQITDTNGCTGLSGSEQIVLTSIDELPGNQLTVYPNPFNNFIYLDNSNRAISIASVEMYDVLGRILYKEEEPVPGNHLMLDATALPTAVYFIRMTTITGEQYSQKIIKQ